MITRWILACLLILILSPGAWAGGKIDQLDTLSQDLFKDLTYELGTAIGYKALQPGDPLDKLGFRLKLEAPASALASEALYPGHYLNRDDNFATPGLSLQGGLNNGFDIGGYYSSVPDSNITLMSGQVSYALTSGNDIAPAVSIRGTFSRLSGVEDFDLMTRGLELSFSKGFASFTPYAGLGTVWIDGDTTVDGLSDERLTKNKYFMGFNFNLGLMSIAAETEQTGDNASTSATFGLRF